MSFRIGDSARQARQAQQTNRVPSSETAVVREEARA
jgi:hypothetical protein